MGTIIEPAPGVHSGDSSDSTRKTFSTVSSDSTMFLKPKWWGSELKPYLPCLFPENLLRFFILTNGTSICLSNCLNQKQGCLLLVLHRQSSTSSTRRNHFGTPFFPHDEENLYQPAFLVIALLINTNGTMCSKWHQTVELLKCAMPNRNVL